MTTLYLARHGQAEWNAKGLIMGQLDSPLTPTGVQQVAKLADYLQSTKFDAVYSSPLGRAVATAKQLQTKLHVPELHTMAELAERNYGEFQGKSGDTYVEAKKAWEPIRAKLPPVEQPRAQLRADVESDAALFNRIMQALRIITERHPDQTVLVVSHEGALSTFLKYTTHSLPVPGSLTNSGYIVVQADHGTFTIQTVEGTTDDELPQ